MNKDESDCPGRIKKTTLKMPTRFGDVKFFVSTIISPTLGKETYYETMIFPELVENEECEIDCCVQEFDVTKDESIKTHDIIVNKIKDGCFKLLPKKFVMEVDDE